MFGHAKFRSGCVGLARVDAGVATLSRVTWRASRALLHASCTLAMLLAGEPVLAAGRGIWIAPEALAALPTEGPAWEHVLAAAALPVDRPNLSDQEDPVNVRVLANALVFARTGEQARRARVVEACRAVMGTEAGGRTLALGRELLAYVVAADLVGLPPEDDRRFRIWLGGVRHRELGGRTLVSTHERRPNNWGTHAGASRMAVAAYLGDRADLDRAARVLRGWLGDRSAWSDFRFGKAWWQADPDAPVGVNPKGATRQGHPIDGVLPDDQRRAGPFAWPPPRTNYTWGALQGAFAQAVILDRAGYDVFAWQDRALLRAVRWLQEVAKQPARGDDAWILHVVNFHYGTDYPAPVPAQPGKNVGFSDWTHGRPRAQPRRRRAAARAAAVRAGRAAPYAGSRRRGAGAAGRPSRGR
jgi:hypothetical protein